MLVPDVKINVVRKCGYFRQDRAFSRSSVYMAFSKWIVFFPGDSICDWVCRGYCFLVSNCEGPILEELEDEAQVAVKNVELEDFCY